MKKQIGIEAIIIGLMMVLTFFLWSNFNPIIASATFAMFVLYWIASGRRFLGRVQLLKQKKELIQTVLIGSVAFVVWIGLSNLLLSNLTETTFSIFSLEVFSQLAQETNLPVIGSADQTMKILVYGITIPVAESVFAFSFLPLILSRIGNVKMTWNPRSPKMWAVISVIALIMAIFHSTVRRFSDVGLVVDFVFFAFSGILLYWRGQLAELILLHIFTNSAVVISEGV